jgi:ABC-type lipoprotein export system ATPase subunit
MDLFTELHAHGRTIVMITHEKDIAAYASRVVELRDGSIIADRRQVATKSDGTSNGRTGSRD